VTRIFVGPCRFALTLALTAGLLASAAAVSAVSASAALAATCPDAHLAPTPTDLTRIANATLCLVNQERATRGLSLLRAKRPLALAAAAHSRDMVARDYFDHVSPAGVDPLARIRRAGYLRSGSGYSLAENIAAAGGNASPAAIVSMWMNSPGHRDNILNPAYRDTGIGVADGLPSVVGAGSGATYTEDFGALG
jgi:uncharacterized protein YkwD